MHNRVDSLPKWAQSHIAELTLRVQTANEPCQRLRMELEKKEATIRRLQDRIDAMVAMFQCAAKGGNEVAQAVQRIVEDYITCE